MYIIEITDTAGNEVWYDGKGWYWTDQYFLLHGPYLTEDGAAYDYAWYINGVMTALKQRGSKH